MVLAAFNGTRALAPESPRSDGRVSDPFRRKWTRPARRSTRTDPIELEPVRRFGHSRTEIISNPFASRNHCEEIHHRARRRRNSLAPHSDSVQHRRSQHHHSAVRSRVRDRARRNDVLHGWLRHNARHMPSRVVSHRRRIQLRPADAARVVQPRGFIRPVMVVSGRLDS
jgi:hypothetical protein